MHREVAHRMSAHSLGMLLAATATVLMLQAMRVFASYLYFATDRVPWVIPAAALISTILAIGLGEPLLQRLGATRVLLLGSGVLALSRLALQFWQLPEARIVLGSVAIVSWGWVIITLLRHRREAVSLGIMTGLGLDLAIRIVFLTVDLPWMPGIAAHVVTLLLVAALVLTAVAVYSSAGTGERGAATPITLIAVGPGLVLFHLVSGNLALAYVKTGLPFPAATSVLSLGVALGISVSALRVGQPGGMRHYPSSTLTGPVVATLGGLGLWLLWGGGLLAPGGLVLASAASTLGLARVLNGAGRAAGRPGTALWFAVGMGLHAVLLITYQALSGPLLLVVLTGTLLVIGALPKGAPPPVLRPWNTGLAVVPAVVAVLLLAASGGQLLAWSEPQAGQPVGRSVTVMTYNIQSGFAADNSWSLERTARAIEAERADVIVLEEVGRGLPLASGVEQALWLSRRLHMPYTFGSASDDGLWGNAILSRAPITAVERHRYGLTQYRKRAAIGVRLETETGEVWVYGTHLASPKGAGQIRLVQVRELLNFWDGKKPALILGDLNADPDDAALNALRAAGFQDAGRSLGPEGFTSQDHRRIDYVLTTPDVTVEEVHIPSGWASDHRAVVARLRLPQ